VRTTQTTDVPALEGLLNTEKVAAIFDVPVSTVERWRGTGYGPPSIRVGKHTRYRAEDVRAWLEEQRGEAARP
jgi:predicted site-specific integrase-resolvase